MAVETVAVDIDTVRTTAERAVRRAGFAEADAALIVDVLLYAELRGNNQGLTKIAEGIVVPDPEAGTPRVLSEFGAVVQIDAARRNGMPALVEAADRAAALAATHGIGAVGVRGTTGSTGAIGYYVRRIAEAGRIGILMCGTPKAVAPAGAVDPVFGTNPVAVGLPRAGDAPIVFDMATGAIAFFGLVAARDRGEAIAPGLAYDGDGMPTTDPAAALGGAIRAFAGHKGSGLALTVELLTGALVGGGLPGAPDANTSRGNLVLAIEPAAFGRQDFASRAEIVARAVKAARPAEPGDHVLLPGERGDRLAAERLALGKIDLDARLWASLQERAGER